MTAKIYYLHRKMDIKKGDFIQMNRFSYLPFVVDRVDLKNSRIYLKTPKELELYLLPSLGTKTYVLCGTDKMTNKYFSLSVEVGRLKKTIFNKFKTDINYYYNKFLYSVSVVI